MKAPRIVLERVGFDCGFAPPDACECLRCNLVSSYADSKAWPSLVNVPDYCRKPGEKAIAGGYCPSCHKWMQTAFVPAEPPAEAMLF